MGDTQRQSPERDCRRSRTKIPVRGSIYRGLRKAHFSPNEWFNNFQLRTTRLLLVIPFLNPNSTASTIRICASICKNPCYMNGGLSGIWNVRFCFFGFFSPPTCPMLFELVHLVFHFLFTCNSNNVQASKSCQFAEIRLLRRSLHTLPSSQLRWLSLSP